MALEIGQYCINVTDLDRSVRFYEEGIGLTVKSRVNYQGLHEVTLAADGGGGLLQLAWTEDLQGPIDHGNALRKIYFYVAECAEAHQRAIAAGGRSERAPERLGDYPVTYAFILDPDGYTIELIQRHSK